MTFPASGEKALSEAGAPLVDPFSPALFPPLPTEVVWGLDRVRELLRRRGDPLRGIPVVLVGGTNGKGSVSAIVAAILRASGLRTGLYTSPHLCAFSERIQMDGVPAPADALRALADALRAELESVRPSFFEAATVLAAEYFFRCRTQVVVLEVGLGGRLDATNAVDAVVTAVTNVAMDHAEYLGPTVADIAREKAGIARPGVPFLTAEADPAIREVLRAECLRRGGAFRWIDPGDLHGAVRTGPGGTEFSLDLMEGGSARLWIPLAGVHQVANAALAVRITESLPAAIRPSRTAVLEGLRTVEWPGRLQVEEARGGVWLLDVAHNPAGVESLLEAVPALGLPRPLVLLAGILADKDWRSMLPPLLREADATILTLPPSAPPARRWSLEAIPGGLGGPEVGGVRLEPDFERALEEARLRAGTGTVLVTGSCHTVGDALSWLGRPPFRTGASPHRSLLPLPPAV